MFGIDILVLASSALLFVASPVQCTVPKAPVINITPKTKKVRYNYSKTSKELSSMMLGKSTPYGPGVDISTGGLRADSPVTNVKITYGYRQHNKLDAVCLWYERIDINIKLAPTIYIAKEFNKSKCRRAVLKHERRHVDVDHIVINQYAQGIGNAVQNSVNQVGALGPYKLSQLEQAKEKINNYVNNAVKLQESLLLESMSKKQQEVDSLEEYKRISSICKNIRIK